MFMIKDAHINFRLIFLFKLVLDMKLNFDLAPLFRFPFVIISLHEYIIS
jgi:hypothetical protein